MIDVGVPCSGIVLAIASIEMGVGVYRQGDTWPVGIVGSPYCRLLTSVATTG